jgi:hypothetical protein
MYKKATLCVFLIVCSLIVSLPAEAQRHRKANLNEDVPLPADFTIDYQMGLTERGKIRGASPLLENTPYNDVGTQVFSKFIANTSVASLGLPYRWNFTIVDNGSVNGGWSTLGPMRRSWVPHPFGVPVHQRVRFLTFVFHRNRLILPPVQNVPFEC